MQKKYKQVGLILIIFLIVLFLLSSPYASARTIEQDIAQEAIDYVNSQENAISRPLIGGRVHQSPQEMVAETFTTRIEELSEDLEPEPSAEQTSIRRDIGTLAKERKKILKGLMVTNPQAVIDNTLTEDTRQTILEEAPSELEERTSKEGEFEVLHSDDFAKERSQFLYFLKTEDGNKTSLHFARDKPTALTGTRVRVEGIKIDNRMAVESADEPGFEVISSAAPVSGAAKQKKKLAVILFNFQDWKNERWTVDQVRQATFTGPNSLNAYYKEVSLGEIEFVGKLREDGDVFGWITLPMNSAQCGCYSCTMPDGGPVRTELAKQGIDLSGYDFLQFMAPCFGSGLGYIGGSWSFTGSLGHIQIHEMGHNLGSMHAHALWCSGGASIGSDCHCSEYGDLFDVMGWDTHHMNAYEKGLNNHDLTWLDPKNVVKATSDGAYSIYPIELPTSMPQRVDVPSGYGGNYVLEYRQNYGFDNFGSSHPVVKGVLIRHTPLSSANYCTAGGSLLLDMTPSTYANFNDAALGVGKSYTDTKNSVTIKTLSADSTNAVVDIRLSGPSCQRKQPTFTISPTAISGYSGQPAAFSYTVVNNDVSCTSSTFTINPTLPSGWLQEDSVPVFQLSPSQSITGKFTLISAADASAGLYKIAENVDYSGGTLYSGKVNLEFNSKGPTPTYVDDFERKDSYILGGLWSRVAGSFSIASGYLNTNGYYNNTAIINGFNGQVLSVSADFTSIKNTNNPRFGVILRYQDPLNYYLMYRQAGAGRVVIEKIVNGQEIVLASANLANPSANKAFNVKGKADGNNLSIYVDGSYKLSAFDSTFSSGIVGINVVNPIGLLHKIDNFNAAREVVQVNCTKNSPSVSISPADQSAQAGQSLEYSISITNNDVNCAPAIITVNPGLPDGFNQTPPLLQDTLSPGQSITSKVSISSSQSITEGNYTIMETVEGGSQSIKSNEATATFTVLPASNLPPVVDLGKDMTVFGLNAQLNAEVSDDGLPNPPAKVSTLWTMTSGPGTVTFNDPVDNLDTIASFSQYGVYTLRLTASDGKASSFDEIKIAVVEKPEEFLDDFARPDSTIIGNGWQEQGDFVIENNTLRINSGVLSKIMLSGFKAHDMDAKAKFISGGNNNGYSAGIILRYKDENNYYSFYRQVGGTSRLVIAKTEDGKATILATKRLSNPVINSPFDFEAKAQGSALSMKVGDTFLQASDSTFIKGSAGFYIQPRKAYRHSFDDVSLLDLKKPNEAPVVSAGSDLKALTGKSAQIFGFVKDDELPSPPEKVDFQWSQLTGPTVNLDAASLHQTITFPSIGTYTFRISASDSDLTASDELSVDALDSFNEYDDEFNRPNSEEIGNNWIETGNLRLKGQTVTTRNVGMSSIILDGFDSQDIFSGADFTMGNTKGSPQFGFLLRYQDKNNYYKLYRLAGSSPKLIISKVVNGAEKVLAYTKYRNPSKAKPFKLTASAAGNQLKIRLSSTAFANATDDAFADGKAGFFIMQPASNLTHSMDNVYIRKNELPPGPG